MFKPHLNILSSAFNPRSLLSDPDLNGTLTNHDPHRALCSNSTFTAAVFLLLQVLGHQSVFINEPRLSDFKQVLLREGIQAEFVGGVLVCNNMVAVRRVSVRPARTERRLFIIWRHMDLVFTFKITIHLQAPLICAFKPCNYLSLEVTPSVY